MNRVIANPGLSPFTKAAEAGFDEKDIHWIEHAQLFIRANHGDKADFTTTLVKGLLNCQKDKLSSWGKSIRSSFEAMSTPNHPLVFSPQGAVTKAGKNRTRYRYWYIDALVIAVALNKRLASENLCQADVKIQCKAWLPGLINAYKFIRYHQ